MDKEKIINDIYQILGKYGEDREDIKADFRKLCDHYKTLKQDQSLHTGDVIVSYFDRFRSGVKKYGYDSEFRKEYESMTAQLRHDKLDSFFDKWDVPKS